MQTPRSILLCALLALLTACANSPTSPAPVTHAEGGTRMPVTGVNGWQFHRVLRFGDYSTSAVGPTVTRTRTTCAGVCGGKLDLGLYYREFDSRFSTATSKIAFTQHGPGGLDAEVRALEQSHIESAEWLTKWFGVPTDFGARHDVTTSFSGTITPAGDDRPAWHFTLVADVGQPDIGVAAGWLSDEAGHVIVIRHMLPPAGTPAIVVRMMHGAGPGLQFERDGRILGAVDLLADGVVTLRDELDPETRFALAGMSSALLLRPRGNG